MVIDINSVIDLRAVAATTHLLPGAFSSARYVLPISDNRVVFELVAPEGQGEYTAINASSFIFVLNGQFLIDGKTLNSGEGYHISSGLSFFWSAVSNTKLFIMRVVEDGEVEPKSVCSNPNVSLSPSAPPSAELLTGPTPSCENALEWRADGGRFYGGIWASTPYQRKKIFYVHYEFMSLLSGQVTFVNQDNVKQTFKVGDAILVCRGARCSWDSRVDVKKMYAIFRPAEN